MYEVDKRKYLAFWAPVEPLVERQRMWLVEETKNVDFLRRDKAIHPSLFEKNLIV